MSNFFETMVPYEGMFYPTAEHAFQAAKTLTVAIRKEIIELPTPLEAKRYGRELLLRDGWENIKDKVMLTIVRSKFAIRHDLALALSRTGDREIIEGNHWGDRYWGAVWNSDKQKWEGKNKLGKILMKVRGEQFRIAK